MSCCWPHPWCSASLLVATLPCVFNSSLSDLLPQEYAQLLLMASAQNLSVWLRLVPHGMCNCWRHCRIRVTMFRLSWRGRSQDSCSEKPAMQQHNPHSLASVKAPHCCTAVSWPEEVGPQESSQNLTLLRKIIVQPMIGHLASTAPGFEAPDDWASCFQQPA